MVVHHCVTRHFQPSFLEACCVADNSAQRNLLHTDSLPEEFCFGIFPDYTAESREPLLGSAGGMPRTQYLAARRKAAIYRVTRLRRDCLPQVAASGLDAQPQASRQRRRYRRIFPVARWSRKSPRNHPAGVRDRRDITRIWVRRMDICYTNTTNGGRRNFLSPVNQAWKHY